MLDLDTLPELPGCYLYKSKEDIVIYVGKAKSLKKRVKSYFSSTPKDPKTQLLVSDIFSLDYIVTTTENEAFILENNLIKKYNPKYNIDLKDSKRYAYILVTDEPYPRLLVARNKSKAGRYYGPFVNAEARDNILKALRTTFGIRTCKKLKKRPCLRFHIKLCSAPCNGSISMGDYQRRILMAEKFLQGNASELIKDLSLEMQEQSRLEHYEKAMIIRDQISSLNYLHQKQSVERDLTYDEDIINYVIDGSLVHIMVFHTRKGILSTKDVFTFEYREGFFEEFMPRYYSDTSVPKEIIIPCVLSDDSIRTYLASVRGRAVKITIPKRGKKRALLDMVHANIEANFLVRHQMMMELKEALRLPRSPVVIECFDISHTSGTYTVGSMVQFREGMADKSNYRRYKIRTVEGIDDFSSMNEVVYRRYSRLVREGCSLPDLIVVDGGKGQLGVALAALKKADAKVPVISLAKRNEEVFVPFKNVPIVLEKNSKALKLLMQIRDEAHRFAISYHKLLRSKGLVNDK